MKERIGKLFAIKGKTSPDAFHKRLGHIMWEGVGMGRTKAGLEWAIEEIRKLRAEFWRDLNVVGTADAMNPELEKALRVADFLEMGELMAKDALLREESCGGHFREEYQTEDGEAKRDDEHFMHVSAWEYKGEGVEPERHIEPLVYENIKVATRNYKS